MDTFSDNAGSLAYGTHDIAYDTSEFDMAGTVLAGLNKHLAEANLPKLEALTKIHEAPNIKENIERYRQFMFSVFRSDEFQSVYKALGKNLIERYFDENAIIQRTPTARIQLPDGGVSVSFHSDGWYGHGSTVNSFWTPLVPVDGTNSLQMARDEPESAALLDRIEKDEMNLDEINELAVKICDPVVGGPGKIVAFNPRMIHGTVPNTTGKCRVSFDFRIAPDPTDLGSKPRSNYYSYAELSGQATDGAITTPTSERRSFSKVFMLAGTCHSVSAKSQLIFINEYCRLNKIDIIGSESEIVTMAHAPVLQTYLRRPDEAFDGVIVFSVSYLPASADTRRQIYKSAIENNIGIIFAAEDMVLTTEDDIDLINIAPNSQSHVLLRH